MGSLDGRLRRVTPDLPLPPVPAASASASSPGPLTSSSRAPRTRFRFRPLPLPSVMSGGAVMMQKIPAGAYSRPGSTANECMPTVVNVIAAIEDPQNNRPKPAVVTPDAVAVSDIHIKDPHINMIPK